MGLLDDAVLRRCGNRVRSLARIIWLLVFCVAAWGCRSVPTSARSNVTAGQPAATSATNGSLTAFTNIPNHQFSTCQKLNPVWWFGNADDPIPPQWYRPGKGSRKLTWGLRNPCNNFTF